MKEFTDPVTELADMCRSLSKPDNKRGDDYLAEKFGVSAWSVGFYRIIFCILHRVEEVEESIEKLEIDDSLNKRLRGNLRQIREAFSKHSLQQNWKDNGGPAKLRSEFVEPIAAIAPMVRQSIKIPKLSDGEIAALIAEVDTLIDWLCEHQLVEQDFIRQAIIDGLKNFRFHLTNFKWVGIGYTLHSLREVIGAYLAFERGIDIDADNPVADAVRKKIGSLFASVRSTIGFAKDIKSDADFLLELYGACSIAVDTGVAGLLTSQ